MKYFIASMRHTFKGDYCITFWKANRNGYQVNLDEAGQYDDGEIAEFIGKKDDFPIPVEEAYLMSVEREYNWNEWKKGHFVLNDEVFYNTYNISSLKDRNYSDKQYFRYVKMGD